MAESLYPPLSRLFVSCDRDTTREELTEAFNPYGSIENIKICRDRATDKPKGFAFIQFDKTSEAAAALEALNGTTIGQSNRPIKISVALSKEQSGSFGTIEPSQYLRLFLIIPKTFTEDDLHEYFSQFGSIDNVSITKDRETKESKGFAYVMFKKFSGAANAFENSDRKYKVVFAKPKYTSGGRSMEHVTSTVSNAEPVKTCKHLDNNPEGYTCLQAMVSVDLLEEQVEWLFDIPPGLEFVHFSNEPPFLVSNLGYSRKVIAQYDSPGTAAYALRKLDGFEYPACKRVRIQPYHTYGEMIPGMQRQQSSPNTVSDLMHQVGTLTKSLNEATRLIRSAGLNTSLGNKPEMLEAYRCSAKLPPPQPLAPHNSTAQERLFVVCEPGLPPQDALWDVFGRFGNLIEFYVLNGKNCGYAKYSDKDSAYRAMQALNGKDLYRMKMKVMKAEPQRDRKRPRTNYD